MTVFPHLPRTLRLVLRETKVNVMLTIEYRAAFFVIMLNVFTGPTISLLVWLAVIERGPGGAALAMDRPQLVTYYVLMSLVSMLTGVWLSEYLADDIRTGNLSKYLLRPAPHMAGALGNNLGEKVIKLMLLGPLVLVAGFLFRHDLRLPADPGTWLLFGLAVALAFLLHFLIDYLLGSLAFWQQAVHGIVTLEGLVAGLLAGRFVPLALFPPELAPLLAAQPWRFTLSFPLEVVTASLSAEQLAYGFGLQVAYIAGLAALIRVVWRYGLRSYAATRG